MLILKPENSVYFSSRDGIHAERGHKSAFKTNYLYIPRRYGFDTNCSPDFSIWDVQERIRADWLKFGENPEEI